MFDGGESLPLLGEEQTTLSDEGLIVPFDASGNQLIDQSVIKCNVFFQVVTN